MILCDENGTVEIKQGDVSVLEGVANMMAELSMINRAVRKGLKANGISDDHAERMLNDSVRLSAMTDEELLFEALDSMTKEMSEDV